jgi:hypothetical protein
MDNDDYDIYEDLFDVTSEPKNGNVLVNAAQTVDNTHVTDSTMKKVMTVNGDENLGDLVIMEKTYQIALKENCSMKEAIQKMGERVTRCETENRVLKANISSLYKTAKAEIERKTAQNAELRRELDNLILRRNQASSSRVSSSPDSRSRSRDTSSSNATSSRSRSNAR